MQQILIINHQSGKHFLMGAEIGLFLEPHLWASKLVSKLKTGNWIHGKNKLRDSMTSVVTSIHNLKQESLFRIKVCFLSSILPLPSSPFSHTPLNSYSHSLLPLHTITLRIFTGQNQDFTKNTTYQTKPTKYYVRIYQRIMQNKPNFQKSQVYANAFSTMAYENKFKWTLSQNKPNQTQNKPNLSQLKPISMPIKPNSNPNQTQIKPCPERIEFTLSVIEGNGPISNPATAFLLITQGIAADVSYIEEYGI